MTEKITNLGKIFPNTSSTGRVLRRCRALFHNRKLRNTPDVIFIWIPKNAGTTVFESLRLYLGMQKLQSTWRAMNLPKSGAITIGHVHWLSLLETGLIDAAYAQNAYKFSIARNPYTRSASLFNYLRPNSQTKSDFDYFLDDVHMKRPPVGLYNSRGLSQTNPQIDWIISQSGRFVVDEIFKLEDIESMVSEIRKRFNEDFQIDTRKNASQKIITIDDIKSNCERIEKINEIYRRDFDLLGYEML